MERLVLVRTIDSLWVEHLTEIDDMRRGIGLRGYAQQDPLNEFRREAYRLYEELRGLIRHGVATTIFRVTVTKQPPPGAEGAGNPSGQPPSGPDPAIGRSLARGAALLGGGAPGKPKLLPGLGGPPAGPNIRNVRESLGDEPVDGSSSASGGAGTPGSGPRPGYTPDGAHRSQRSVLVRVRQQVQEVPRPLSG